MARFPFIAVFTLLFFLVAEGPSEVKGGPLNWNKIKLTKEQEEAVNKVDGLLNQLLNNIRQYYLEKNPHLKPDPVEEYPEDDYPEESYSNDVNFEEKQPEESVGTEDNIVDEESNDDLVNVPDKVDNDSEGEEGKKEGEKEIEEWDNNSNDDVVVASDNVDGEEHPITGEKGHGDGGGDWDDGRIIFPDQ